MMSAKQTKNDASPGEQYRLSAQAKSRADEGFRGGLGGPYLDDTVSGTDKTARQVAPKGVKIVINRWLKGSSLSLLEWLLLIFSIVAFIWVVLIGRETGSFSSKIQMGVIATFPLVGATAILGWIDRWAPPKMRYKIIALIWGAGIAAGIAVIINTAMYQDILFYTGDFAVSDSLSAVVIAPIVEEFFKGLGVFLVLILARNRVSSNLSGLALGGLVGAGFAYVENILYFLDASQESFATLGFTIVARGVFSPFIHPVATSFTGVAVASAILNRAGWFGWLWRLFLGLIIAMGIHALWNGLATVAGITFPLWYVFVILPLFVAWLVTIIVLSNRQIRKIELGLRTYSATGWISETEIQMLTNPVARKYAKRWARRIGRPAPKRVKSFQRAIAWLGLDQLLMERTGPWPQRLENDRKLLLSLEDIRQEFQTLEEISRATAPGQPTK